MADKNLQDIVSRLESVTTRLESLSVGGGGGAGVGDGEVAPFVTAYDDLLSGPVADYFSHSNTIGGDVKTQADLVKKVFDAQREFLVVASKSKQPDQGTLMELLQSSATKLQAVQDFREKNRSSKFFNHLSTVSESIPALGWVTVSPAPGPYVKELGDAGIFYKNRIIEIKEKKDPVHTNWGKSWTTIMSGLQSYIKDHHTTGVTWNPKGKDAKAVKSSGAAPPPPPPPAGAPPPPPPPPAGAPSESSEPAVDTSALFASINKGDAVTKGLRKITDDMKTHKNPALRKGPVPFKPSEKPKAVAAPVAKSASTLDKEPVTELQGKKWIIEYHKGNQNIVLENVNMAQTVYIYKCEGSVIQIKAKVNSIIMDSCKKCGIVFEDVLSVMEFVNCQSAKGQVNGKVNTISIDKTDGCMIYLNPNCLNVEIVTAKSSEMNVLVQGGDGDYKEFALPEQFKTVYNTSTSSFQTTTMDLNL